MSSCGRIQTYFNDFLDGTLAAPQAQELNAHLQECAACRREYRALKATQELIRNVAVPADPAVQRRVLSRFRQTVAADAAARASDAPRLPLLRRLHVAPMGAAVGFATLLLLVAIPQFRRSHRDIIADSQPIVIATAACNAALPTANDLDQMTSAHAIQSLTMQNGNAEMQQETLADANSRLYARPTNTP